MVVLWWKWCSYCRYRSRWYTCWRHSGIGNNGIGRWIPRHTHRNTAMLYGHGRRRRKSLCCCCGMELWRDWVSTVLREDMVVVWRSTSCFCMKSSGRVICMIRKCGGTCGLRCSSLRCCNSRYRFVHVVCGSVGCIENGTCMDAAAIVSVIGDNG